MYKAFTIYGAVQFNTYNTRSINKFSQNSISSYFLLFWQTLL